MLPEAWRLLLKLGLAASASLLSGTETFAAEWSANATVGVIRTDNLMRDSANELEADARLVAVDLSVRESTPHLELDVDGGLVYREYDVRGIGGDDLPSLNGLLRWVISPDRFAWVVAENYGQRAANANDALSPVDREGVNVTGIGPELRLQAGSAIWLTGAARASWVDYENSPADSRRLYGQAGVAWELDTKRIWSIDFTHARTRPEDVGDPFTIQSLYTQYSAQGARGAFDGKVGATSLRADGRSRKRFLCDLRVEYALSARTTFFLDYVDRLADASEVFSRRQNLGQDINEFTDAIASSKPLRERSVDASLSWVSRRSRLQLGAAYAREKPYDDEAIEDRTVLGAHLRGAFRPQPRLELEGRFEWRRESPELAEPRHIRETGLTLRWRFARSFALNLGGEHYALSGASSDYDETRWFVLLSWGMQRGQSQRVPLQHDTPARRRLALPRS